MLFLIKKSAFMILWQIELNRCYIERFQISNVILYLLRLIVWNRQQKNTYKANHATRQLYCYFQYFNSSIIIKIDKIVLLLFKKKVIFHFKLSISITKLKKKNHWYAPPKSSLHKSCTFWVFRTLSKDKICFSF